MNAFQSLLISTIISGVIYRHISYAEQTWENKIIIAATNKINIYIFNKNSMFIYRWGWPNAGERMGIFVAGTWISHQTGYLNVLHNHCFDHSVYIYICIHIYLFFPLRKLAAFSENFFGHPSGFIKVRVQHMDCIF